MKMRQSLKTAALLLALMMIASLLSARAEDISPAGDWYLRKLIVFNPQRPFGFFICDLDDGYGSALTLRPDGTGSWEGEDIAWELHDGRCMLRFGDSDSSVSFAPAGDWLIVDGEASSAWTWMVYTREAPPNHAKKTAGSAADFNGIWHLTTVYSFGMALTPAQYGKDIILTVNYGMITLEDRASGKTSWFLCLFRDGILTGITLTNRYEARLTGDGGIMLTEKELLLDILPTDMYFERAE